MCVSHVTYCAHVYIYPTGHSNLTDISRPTSFTYLITQILDCSTAYASHEKVCKSIPVSNSKFSAHMFHLADHQKEKVYAVWVSEVGR